MTGTREPEALPSTVAGTTVHELVIKKSRFIARAVHVESVAEAPAELSALVQPGDLLVTLGAGDVTVVGPALAERLRERG